MTPSVFTQEMLQSTEQRLRNTKEVHRPQVLEWLDTSNTQHHKVNVSSSCCSSGAYEATFNENSEKKGLQVAQGQVTLKWRVAWCSDKLQTWCYMLKKYLKWQQCWDNPIRLRSYCKNDCFQTNLATDLHKNITQRSSVKKNASKFTTFPQAAMVFDLSFYWMYTFCDTIQTTKKSIKIQCFWMLWQQHISEM